MKRKKKANGNYRIFGAEVAIDVIYGVDIACGNLHCDKV